MHDPVALRPKAWLFAGCVLALIAAPIALQYVPNPFADLAPGERPVRFFMLLWLALPVATLLSAWRLATWTTYRATSDALQARSWFGSTRLAWRDVTAAYLDSPRGMPPAYELHFGKRKVRFIAAHFDQAGVRALKTFLIDAGATQSRR